MEIKLTYYSEVKDGKLQPICTKRISEWIKSMEGKCIAITLSKKKKTRSLSQNAYYWAICIPIVKDRIVELGNEYSTEDTHNELKRRFLTEDIHIKDGELIQRTKSTSDLTTTEFMEYILKIQEWASTILDIYIPSPNEQLKIES
jgi:hypothetical protein